MIHIGKNTRSRIAQRHPAGHSDGTYRGLVRILKSAEGARNHTQCDSLLIGDKCGAHTVPYIEVRNRSAKCEHEATTSRPATNGAFISAASVIPEDIAVLIVMVSAEVMDSRWEIGHEPGSPGHFAGRQRRLTTAQEYGSDHARD